MAVVLIGKADLIKSLSCKASIDEVFALHLGNLGPRFLFELIHTAASFSFTTYEANPDESDEANPAGYESYYVDAFKTMRLFNTMYFDGGYPGEVEVFFHPDAIAILQQLQSTIHNLFQQDDLRPSSLLKHMQNANSLTYMQLSVKPPSQPQFIDTLRCMEGLPPSLSSQYEKRKDV